MPSSNRRTGKTRTIPYHIAPTGGIMSDTTTNSTSQHKYTNRLINETSPYLLQHAHNPVDWYPWGEEALQKARQENKPILLSVGYSACHWCHVMERESFENEDIAALMNQHFVSIKVDREERPDIDNIYMQAVQAITQQGGWPMTVFLTPDGRPFYGGTYFPPRDRQYGQQVMPGFPRVLQTIADLYKDQRKEIEEQASQVADYLKQSTGTPPRSKDGISPTCAVRLAQRQPRQNWRSSKCPCSTWPMVAFTTSWAAASIATP